MVTGVSEALAAADSARAENRDLDRWFFAAVAVFFFITVLLGFVPSSIDKLNAVAAGARPPIPLAQHAHAVVMGSWIVLLLAQSFVVVSGRVHLHRRLGLVAFALVPTIALVMILVTRSVWIQVASLPAGALPPATLAAAKAGLSDILLEQIRAAILFLLFAGWAMIVRRTDSEMHKRLMIFATLMALSAAIDRVAIRWLPTTFPGGYESEYGYMLLWLAPALIYDLWRRGRVHRAYVIGIACNVPFFVATHFLWSSPRWMQTAPAIMRALGVSGW